MLYNFCVFDVEGREREKLVKSFEKAVKEGRAVKLHKPGITNQNQSSGPQEIKGRRKS